MVINLNNKKKIFIEKINFYLIKKHLLVYIYVFIIFSSMLPNKDNIQNLTNLNTIVPGINNIKKNDEKKEEETRYTFKLFEILENIF